jgi:15-cis-phytoene synthase
MSSNPPRPYEAGSSFRPAFFFLAPEQRRALSALYGFARTVDDIADDGTAAPREKETALAAWKVRLEALFTGGPAQNRLEAELAWAAGFFAMNKENLLFLLEGVGMDARPREYASFEDLKPYMYRVASAVGLSCLEIFGWRGEQAAAYAENLGYAVQLTNIIRDVFEDARAGRTYIPLEDFKTTGCDRAALKDSAYPEKFQELMRLEAGRARRFYSAADELAEGTEKKKILSAFIMAQVYHDLLGKLEARGFRTDGARIGLNGFEKSRAVYRAWRKSRGRIC